VHKGGKRSAPNGARLLYTSDAVVWQQPRWQLTGAGLGKTCFNPDIASGPGPAHAGPTEGLAKLPWPYLVCSNACMGVHSQLAGFAGTGDESAPCWISIMCVLCAEEVLERDFFMSAEEAKDFGIVDEVILERPKVASDLE
jgi:hypothetical protein